MKFTFDKCVVNVIPVTNPTVYVKLSKQILKNRNPTVIGNFDSAYLSREFALPIHRLIPGLTCSGVSEGGGARRGALGGRWGHPPKRLERKG